MLKVVDLFCGMGGATLGYENSGCKVVLAIDKWEEALETHSANIPDVPTLCCDISVIPLDEIPEADVYHLSPPCQSFSTSGKQEGFQSANGNLFLLSLNILKEKKPNIFIIENVKGLLSHLAKNPNIFAGFEEYHINQLLLNARDCGVCQSRERVFIIGIKKAFGYFEIPDKEKNNQTFQDVINAVEGNNYGLPEHSQSLIRTEGDISSLEKRLKLLPNYISSIKDEISEEQLKLKRVSDLIAAYEKIVEGNYIDNLIRAQREQELAKNGEKRT